MALLARLAVHADHHGFVPVPEHPLRLYRRLKDVRASLEQALEINA